MSKNADRPNARLPSVPGNFSIGRKACCQLVLPEAGSVVSVSETTPQYSVVLSMVLQRYYSPEN